MDIKIVVEYVAEAVRQARRSYVQPIKISSVIVDVDAVVITIEDGDELQTVVLDVHFGESRKR